MNEYMNQGTKPCLSSSAAAALSRHVCHKLVTTLTVCMSVSLNCPSCVIGDMSAYVCVGERETGHSPSVDAGEVAAVLGHSYDASIGHFLAVPMDT